MEIRGKVALVTGAGSGIGQATARALKAEGAKLIVCDVNEAALNAFAQELGGACLLGGAAVAFLQAQGKLPPTLADYGLQPTLLFTVGAVVFGIGLVRRQLARVEAVAARQQEAPRSQRAQAPDGH